MRDPRSYPSRSKIIWRDFRTLDSLTLTMQNQPRRGERQECFPQEQRAWSGAWDHSAGRALAPTENLLPSSELCSPPSSVPVLYGAWGKELLERIFSPKDAFSTTLR